MAELKIIIEYKSPQVVNFGALASLGVTVRSTSRLQPTIVHALATPEQIREIARDPNVVRVHTVEDVQAFQDITIMPLGHMEGSEVISREEARKLVNADESHRIATGRNVRVAVLDTGVRSTNPLLEGKIINKIQVAEGNLEDSLGHGTHVAGIILNIAPDAQIINTKVLNDEGSGDFSTIMIGIEKAVDAGAQIINMSLGGYPDVCLDNHPFSNLMRTLSNRGIIFCCAAGNVPNNQSFPAIADSAIAVGATDFNNQIAPFSAQGPSPCNRTFPDVSAPGVNIESTFIGGDKVLSGTSMATPHVAGMFALVVQISGGMDKNTAENLLGITAKREGIGKNNIMGWGVIDCAKAVEYRPQPVKAGVGLPFFLGGLLLLPSLFRGSGK